MNKWVHTITRPFDTTLMMTGFPLRYNLSAHLDPSNAGVLIVDLRGNEGGGRSRDVGGLLNAMNGKNGTCSIM